MPVKEKYKSITVEEIKNDPMVHKFIEAADEYLNAVGYTEHSFRHVSLVSSVAKNTLIHLGYKEPLPELAGVAGYLHDIGNVVNRQDHGQSAALIAFKILKSYNVDPKDIAIIISAIGNHEEEIGEPNGPVAAALILADKSDVHKSRVRNPNMIGFDIHDRVNYAVDRSFLKVDGRKKLITLEFNIDTSISQVMEYFEIFMSRMVMCRRAAKFFGCRLELIVNGKKLL